MNSTYISAALRRQIIERGGNCCEYCKMAQADQFSSFEIDHIIAEKHAGITGEEDLCLAFIDCNGLKGSVVACVDWADNEAIVGLYNLHRHLWLENFQLDTTTGRILPLASYGRVITFLLQLDAPERVIDRQLLLAEDRYHCGMTL